VRFTRVKGASPRRSAVPARLAFEDGGRGLTLGSDVIGVNRFGVLQQLSSGAWTFLTWRGARAWSLADPPVTKIEEAVGHFVATNTSGQRVVVDSSSGKAARLDPGVKEVVLALTGDNAGEVVLADPNADVLMYSRHEGDADRDLLVVHRASWTAVCAS
jgi:hypothetical protein